MLFSTIGRFNGIKEEHILGSHHTSINLRDIFKQNVVFLYNFLLSFIDFIKVGISNKP
ncbi:hypothetical protein BCAH1134_C0678 (plasmid) [Bacillus cereus AH1134]|nr:hypothetical protein BCAH1134_C0678 [Bacillus cereus AH1134]